MSESKKLGLFALMFVVVGSMIGGGAFNLPADMASSAGPGAVLLGWLITGIGIISLALVYQTLVSRKPELNGGVYSYAKAGFGNYIGFNSAWGYWLSALLGNVAYATLLFGTLSYFFPVFGEGNNLWSIVGASILLWAVHFLILKGIKEAALVNIITTIGKLIPILLFVIIALFAANFRNLNFEFWGNADLGSVFDQVKNTMLVTLWVFIGVEGAVVLSSRAENKSDVGKATILGLLGTLVIYVLISVLSLGVMARADLAGLSKPSMAYVLESIVGVWGATIINIGLVISLLGAWLGWTLLGAEISWVASKDGVLPKLFARENKNGSPVSSLWITNGIIQILLIVVYFNESTYNLLYSIATTAILIPYLFSGLYGLKLAFIGETYTEQPKGRTLDFVVAGISTVYAVWLVYAAGLTYLLLCSILYAPGYIFYIMARKESKNKLFSVGEVVIALIVVVAAAVAVLNIMSGKIQL